MRLGDEVSDQECLSEFEDRLRAMFPVQLLGEPCAVSEYGMRYVTLANGFVKPEGAATYSQPLTNSVEDTLKWFSAQRANGGDAIVWRARPCVDRSGANTVLYMRCHTINAMDIVKLQSTAKKS